MWKRRSSFFKKSPHFICNKNQKKEIDQGRNILPAFFVNLQTDRQRTGRQTIFNYLGDRMRRILVRTCIKKAGIFNFSGHFYLKFCLLLNWSLGC